MDFSPLLPWPGVCINETFFIPHTAYQDFVLHQLQTYYGSGLVIIHKDFLLVTKLWQTDLSYITTMLQDSYSDHGPLPQDLASMLRS
jgi:hypothetical protein